MEQKKDSLGKYLDLFFFLGILFGLSLVYGFTYELIFVFFVFLITIYTVNLFLDLNLSLYSIHFFSLVLSTFFIGVFLIPFEFRFLPFYLLDLILAVFFVLRLLKSLNKRIGVGN